jgi:RND family efflux transporter MFP subunit
MTTSATGVRAAAAFGLAALVLGCHREAPPREGTAPAPPRAVRTAPVRALDAGGETSAATVVARSRAVLSPRTMAAVTALPLREGERFAAGALLARLDDRALVAAHAAAAAAAAVAESDRARAESLLARGAATPREAEQARAHAEAARAAELAAREALSYAELRAPFAGTVAARPAHVGDVVGPGTTLLEVEGVDGLELRAEVDGGQAARLAPGQRLTAVVDGVAAPVTATVRSLSMAGDPGTHRFELRAALPPASGLRSGLFARLALPGPARAERLVAPAESVFTRGGLTGVFVVSEGHARLRWIAAGAPTDDGTEVRAGLAEGERVVLAPARDLDDGQPVTEQP